MASCSKHELGGVLPLHATIPHSSRPVGAARRSLAAWSVRGSFSETSSMVGLWLACASVAWRWRGVSVGENYRLDPPAPAEPVNSPPPSATGLV